MCLLYGDPSDFLLYSDRLRTFSRNQHFQQSGRVTNAYRDSYERF